MNHIRRLLSALAILTLSATAASAQALTEDKVNELIKNYIYNHPEQIVDALQKWQLQEEAGRVTEQREALQKLQKTALAEDYLPRAGNPKGDVTIIEFFDYNCPACKMMFETLDGVMKEDKKLNVIFVEFPIFGPQSEENAKLGLAVYKLYPNKYFDFHAGMMRSKGRIDVDAALRITKNLGMDDAKLRAEIAKPIYDEYIAKDRKTAGELMIQGTPAVIVGRYITNSALSADELKTQIDWMRTGKKD